MALEQQLETLNTNIVNLIAVLQGMPASDAGIGGGSSNLSATAKAAKPKASKPAPEPAPEPEGKYPPFNGTAYLKKGGECVTVKTLTAFQEHLDNGFKIITEKAYAEATAASEPPKAAQITYDTDVKPLILELAKKGGRDAAFEVLQSFGVDKGPSLKEEQYADVVKALRAKIDALPA